MKIWWYVTRIPFSQKLMVLARCSIRLLWQTTCNVFLRQDNQSLCSRRRISAATGYTTRVPSSLSITLSNSSSHEGPVWQVAWAHPKFGTILASASYDARVIIWRDSSTSPQQSAWTKLFEHTVHTSSINSIAWAPHELGALLACASSDGKVSVLEFKDDGSWDTKVFNAHGMGCNAVSWAPAIVPGKLLSTQPDANVNQKKLATGGCDNLIKIWGLEYAFLKNEVNT